MLSQHAAATLQWPKIKEMLASCAKSSMGKEKAMALAPTEHLTLARALQEETLQAESILYRRGDNPMQPFEDIRSLMGRVRAGGVLSMEELLKLAQMLRACGQIAQGMQGHQDIAPNLTSQAAFLAPHRHLEQEISRCILSPEEMSDAASGELASIRRRIRQCNSNIREKLQSMIHSPSIQKCLQDALVTQRGGRYVLPVRQEYRASIPGMVHDQSASGATLYIEPMAVVQINNDLRELVMDERREMARILASLSAQVNEVVDDLAQNIETMSELDAIFARAELARSMDAVQPKLNDVGWINIVRGRHPLIDRAQVVPIDLWMGKDFTTLVVTGPNTGGKTVTLKTVGLFSIMAQSGLFVPAEAGTELCVFADIFADIGDEQSIEQSLSTFSAHMTNIVRILSQVSDRALVLLDELGAGTDPVEGAALAMAILEHLRALRVRTLATTHYSELKAYAMTTDGVQNASAEFDIATLRPTYRLSIGIPGSSNAFEISKRLGLEEALIARARALVSHEDRRFEEVISTAEQEKRAAAAERDQAQRAKLEAERLQAEARKARDAWINQRDKMLARAQEEAQRIVEEAQQESRALIAQMHQLLKEGAAVRPHQMQALQKQLRTQSEKLGERRVAAPKAQQAHQSVDILAVGQKVLLTKFNQKATVLALPNEAGEVQVQAGAMKMMVQKKDLAMVLGGGMPQPSAPQRRNVQINTRAISAELDIRGCRQDEGREKVDKYLDDAVLSGLTEVRIIHGKGTGALRAGMREYLRTHPLVQSVREGKYGEGDAGVSVVTLK
nr:endonuclease MutS2 [Maliibacterium massiliense]